VPDADDDDADLTEEEIKDLEAALKEMEQKIQNTDKSVEKIKESDSPIEGLSLGDVKTNEDMTGDNIPTDSGEATIDDKMLKELEIALTQDVAPEVTPDTTPTETSTETVATAPDASGDEEFSDDDITAMLKEIGIGDEQPVDESGLSISDNNSKKTGAEITGDMSSGKLNHERPAVKDALAEEVKDLKTKIAKLEAEKKEILSINEGFQKTSIDLRSKLNEMAVLHTNTAHVNKIFVDNATTINEKKDIVKRFNSIQSIDESKQMYKTIITELTNTPTIQEQLDTKTVQSGSATQITESVAYSEDDRLKRIKRLMTK
jgi:hypothetical protein